MMRIHFEQHTSLEEKSKTFLVISYLTKEAEAITLSKPQSDHEGMKRSFNQVSKRFYTRRGELYPEITSYSASRRY